MSSFDVNGRLLEQKIGSDGHLYLEGEKGNKIVPTNKVIFTKGEDLKMLSPHFITTAPYDKTYTRVHRKCDSCEYTISIILSHFNITFYICEGCQAVTQVS